ncbi:hypothetical protein ABW19_dt0210164 [Dactylella cylindrospora]|nr:hypothetical protein ABW19_dt0210164 [Dactylella cylindrospora]
MPTPLDLTDTEIVERCWGDSPRFGSGTKRISSHLFVKFGKDTTPEEVANLQIAAKLLDPTIIRVPHPYRYFVHDGIPYLVMEYIEGREINEEEYGIIADRIFSMVKYFQTLHGATPGSLGCGIARGFMWRTDWPNFKTLKQLENWINTRLRRVRIAPIKFIDQDQELVFCHLDLAPRNLILKDDGSLYLLDWESAGWYPRYFELARLEIFNSTTTGLEELLYSKFKKDLSESEYQKAVAIKNAWLICDSSSL